MKLVFMGPQGSGKGTQAKIVAEKLGISHISTGDLIRNTKGGLKQKVDSYINKGELIPDELMMEILKQRIGEKDCEKGFILDGFPRNLKQMDELEKRTNTDKIIEIDITDKEAVKRLSGRRNCVKCGRIYNILTSPKPKKDNLCDSCKIPLNQREDDCPWAIKKRLEIYHKETKPILKKYDAIKIDGTREIKRIAEDILKNLR